MWVLESDGDLFGGKRIWLRPGQTWLFGRTSVNSPGHRGFAISHKGVSRKHLTISLTAISEGQGARINDRAKLTITDDSKFGTTLDNDKFVKDTRLLDKDVHTIRLGSYEQILKLTWHNVVLTATSTKAIALKSNRSKLEPFDIKIITEFLLNSTTHVLAAKRNLPKVLQGILGAKYIVTESYVDALVQACASPGRAEDDETPLPSPLEQDFDAAWPDPMRFVPEPSNEPVPRESNYLKPDLERTALFESFTFIFCDYQQQSSLEPALSLGGAKCPLCPVEPGVTTASEAAKFIRELAGKGNKESLSESNPKGVVVVRLQPKKDDTEAITEWMTNFVQGVDRDLEQRSIEQREFLDAILTKDTSGLMRGLQYEDESALPPSNPEAGIRSEPPRSKHSLSSRISSQQQQPQSQQRNMSERDQASRPSESQAPSQPSPAKPSRLRTRRLGTNPKPKFRGFDNFDDDAAPALPPDSTRMEEDSGSLSNQAVPGATQDHSSFDQNAENGDSQGLFVSQDLPAASTRSKKRAQPPADSDGEPLDPNEAMEKLLPGSRALKRRRLEEGTLAPAPAQGTPTRSAGASSDEAPTKSTTEGKGSKMAGQPAELRQRAKQRAQAIDKVKHEDEGDEEGSDVDVSKLRDLALVEDMDVPRLRDRAQSPDSSVASTEARHTRGNNRTKSARGRKAQQKKSRNDDAEEQRRPDPWAGRKNFKRFRRKGQAGAEQGAYNHGTRVIVPLQEVPSRDYGIGDRYWSMPSSSASKKKTSQSQSQVRKERMDEDEEDGGEGEDMPALNALVRREREDVEADERERERLRHVVVEELAGPQRGLWNERVEEGAGESQMRGTAKGKKRAASGTSRRESPAKKRQTVLGGLGGRERGRQAPMPAWGAEDEEEDDDDDELAFKLRRR